MLLRDVGAHLLELLMLLLYHATTTVKPLPLVRVSSKLKVPLRRDC
jgi:hypothetical protein